MSTNPFQPLSREELSAAVALLKVGPAAADTFRFSSVSLKEQSRAALREGTVTREAKAVLIDRSTGLAYEAVVNLDTHAVTAWLELPAGTQPPIMMDEFTECEEAIKKDSRVVEALAKRGLTDLSLVCAEPWSVGYFGDDMGGRRVMRALMYTRLLDEDDNCFAHPMEKFTVLVDLNKQEVIDLEDDGFLHVPTELNNYHPKFVGPARSDLTMEVSAVRVPRTSEELAPVRAALEALMEAYQTKDAAEIAARDLDFHAAIVGMLNSKRIDAFYAQLAKELRYLLRVLFVEREVEMEAGVVEEHQKIMAALESGDPSHAVDVLTEVLTLNAETVLAIFATRTTEEK